MGTTRVYNQQTQGRSIVSSQNKQHKQKKNPRKTFAAAVNFNTISNMVSNQLQCDLIHTLFRPMCVCVSTLMDG